MILRSTIFALGALCGVALGASAGTPGVCGAEADADLLWSNCDGEGRAALLLLPEDAGLTPDDALDVTGVYTATDRREEGKPKPVGLFVRRGEIVSREYARFDGVLLIDRDGAPRILHRRRAEFGGKTYDLDEAEARQEFVAAVAGAGASVSQSHLLIVDGEVDAFDRDGAAPRFRRRILLQAREGETAIYDSSPRPLTLAEAAEEVKARYAPAMAINLDMGSYDFCRMGQTSCGLLSYADTGKLSNIIRFRQGAGKTP